MLAGLSYELPAILECESYMDAITWINRLPNSQLGTITPYQLVTGQKSFLPRYHFGQVGLFHSPNKEFDLRSEWGIFIGYGPTSNYLRAYLPLKKHMYSKRRFSPQAQIPAELGLVPRLRIVAPSPSPPPLASSPPGNTDIQTGAVPRASLSPTVILSDQLSPPSVTTSSRSGAALFQPQEDASVSEGASAASAAVPPQFVSHPEGAVPTGVVPYPSTVYL